MDFCLQMLEKRVVETINNVDIGELGDASVPGAVQALD